MKALTEFFKVIYPPVLKTFFQFEVYGLENLNDIDGGVILAGNHTGLLDGPMLLSAIDRPFNFIVREEVLGWGLIGKIIPFLNTIVIKKRTMKSDLKSIVKRLSNGETICIFPEGSLTKDGEIKIFKGGIGFLHQKSKAPIVPFYISGGFEAWPEGARLPKFSKISLTFGKPITGIQANCPKELAKVIQQNVFILQGEQNGTI